MAKNRNKRNGIVRNKPVHVLLQQRKNFLKECPVCGRLNRYIKGTTFVYCDHDETEHYGKKLYMRSLNTRGCKIAEELFGKAK